MASSAEQRKSEANPFKEVLADTFVEEGKKFAVCKSSKNGEYTLVHTTTFHKKDESEEVNIANNIPTEHGTIMCKPDRSGYYVALAEGVGHADPETVGSCANEVLSDISRQSLTQCLNRGRNALSKSKESDQDSDSTGVIMNNNDIQIDHRQCEGYCFAIDAKKSKEYQEYVRQVSASCFYTHQEATTFIQVETNYNVANNCIELSIGKFGDCDAMLFSHDGRILYSTSDETNNPLPDDPDHIIGKLAIGGGFSISLSKHAKYSHIECCFGKEQIQSDFFLVVCSNGLSNTIRDKDGHISWDVVNDQVLHFGSGDIVYDTDLIASLFLQHAKKFTQQRIEQTNAAAGDDITIAVVKLSKPPQSTQNMGCVLC